MPDRDILYDAEPEVMARPPRADARAASVRSAQSPMAGERLTRRRRNADPINILASLAPRGWTYEWKREEVYGWRDTDHIMDIRENHWRPVPASRHPELCMPGDTVIRRGGTVLMERPFYLTDEARMEDMQAAIERIEDREIFRAPPGPGQFPRNHPMSNRAAVFNKTYEPPSGDYVQVDDGGFSEP